jgi:hypothetical protein
MITDSEIALFVILGHTEKLWRYRMFKNGRANHALCTPATANYGITWLYRRIFHAAQGIRDVLYIP